jgi:hypothetical protein
LLLYSELRDPQTGHAREPPKLEVESFGGVPVDAVDASAVHERGDSRSFHRDCSMVSRAPVDDRRPGGFRQRGRRLRLAGLRLRGFCFFGFRFAPDLTTA